MFKKPKYLFYSFVYVQPRAVTGVGGQGGNCPLAPPVGHLCFTFNVHTLYLSPVTVLYCPWPISIFNFIISKGGYRRGMRGYLRLLLRFWGKTCSQFDPKKNHNFINRMYPPIQVIWRENIHIYKNIFVPIPNTVPLDSKSLS